MKKKKGAKDKEKPEIETTTEVDMEYDILDELTTSIGVIEEAIERSETETLADTFSYMRYLIKEFEDTLSGDFEPLRLRRFISKTSK